MRTQPSPTRHRTPGHLPVGAVEARGDAENHRSNRRTRRRSRDRVAGGGRGYYSAGHADGSGHVRVSSTRGRRPPAGRRLHDQVIRVLWCFSWLIQVADVVQQRRRCRMSAPTCRQRVRVAQRHRPDRHRDGGDLLAVAPVRSAIFAGERSTTSMPVGDRRTRPETPSRRGRDLDRRAAHQFRTPRSFTKHSMGCPSRRIAGDRGAPATMMSARRRVRRNLAARVERRFRSRSRKE